MTGEQLEKILASGDPALIADTARLLLAALGEAEAEVAEWRASIPMSATIEGDGA